MKQAWHRNASLLATICAFMHCNVYAQTPDNGIENDVGIEGGQDVKNQDNEIVVTARKREESIQDVPLSITSIDGSQLSQSGVIDATDLYGEVPGLYFSAGGSPIGVADFNYITIRGVGFNAGLEPSVGVFVDGMYQPQIGIDAAFLDAERIEVLRGPQGTLFGRNTQAGAVNIVTRKPTDDFRGTAQVGVAEFGTIEAMMNASGPLSNDLFFGLAASYNKTDGFVKNINYGGDASYSKKIAVRGKLRWVPTERLEAEITGQVSRQDYEELAYGAPLKGRRYTSSADDAGPDARDSYGLQANLSYELSDSIDVKSITGLTKARGHTFIDADGKPTPNDTILIFPVPPGTPMISAPVTAVSGDVLEFDVTQRFFSQELRLEGAHEIGDIPVNWLLGGYYFEQKARQLRRWNVGVGATTILPPLLMAEDFRDNRTGEALFSQFSIKPAPSLEITLGGRYSREEVRSYRDRLLELYLGPGVFVPQPIEEERNKATFSNVSLLASASYDISKDVMTYFTYSQGWKAGGIARFPTRAGADLPFDDETSENFELGIKSSILDGMLTANFTAFYVKISDQQLATVIADPNGGTPISAVFNAGKSRVRGIEAEVAGKLSDRLSISLSLGYADTEILEGTRGSFNLRGLDFENVPELTSTQSITYRFPVSSGWNVELNASGQYVGGYRVEDASIAATDDLQLKIPSYFRTDLSASLVSDDDWRFTIYVKNVADSDDYVHALRNVVVAPPFTDDSVYVRPLSPRMFGVRVSKSF